jgi:hypothetical protein
MRLEGLSQLKKIHLIGTRSRDLPACSIVPQPTRLPRAPIRRCEFCIKMDSRDLGCRDEKWFRTPTNGAFLWSQWWTFGLSNRWFPDRVNNYHLFDINPIPFNQMDEVGMKRVTEPVIGNNVNIGDRILFSELLRSRRNKFHIYLELTSDVLSRGFYYNSIYITSTK